MRKQLLLIGVLFFVFTFSVNSVSGYTYTGTVYENGDSYFDDNEMAFLEFELDEGERLEIEFSASADLELMLCDCSDKGDIEKIFEDIIYTGEIPEELYGWMDSYEYTSGVYTAPERIDVTIAVFSWDTSNPSSITYEVTTNLPEGDRIQDYEFVWILAIIAIIGFFIYRRKNNSKPSTSNQSSYSNYQQPTQGYQQPKQSQGYQSQPSSDTTQALFCPNCGTRVSSVFCTECGTQVNE